MQIVVVDKNGMHEMKNEKDISKYLKEDKNE